MPGIATSFAFDGSPLSSATEPDARASYAVLELDGHRVRAITRHPWNLIWDQKSGEKKLFNLELDEREIWDLTERHPDHAAALLEELASLIDTNEMRREALHVPGETSPAREVAVPEAARKALKALGYIED